MMSNTIKSIIGKCAYFIVELLLVSVLNACTKSADDIYEGGQNIKIDINNAESLIRNMAQIEGVRLEDSVMAFPGEVLSAVFAKDYFVLLDSYSARGVYGYDYEGKQIFAYDKIGQGPEEMLSLSDMQVYNDSIYILDNMANKIIVTDRRGNFLTKIDCPVHSMFFAMGENADMYFDHVNNSIADNCYNVTYTNGDLVKGIIPIQNDLKDVTIGSAHSLTNIGNKVSYLMPSTPLVLECDNGDFSVRYHFDFGKYWPNNEVLKSGRHPYQIMQDLINGDFAHDLRFVESESNFCLSFKKSHRLYYFIYNKNTDKSKIFVEDEEDFGHPLGFDNHGRLVMMSRSDSPAVLYCTLLEL